MGMGEMKNLEGERITELDTVHIQIYKPHLNYNLFRIAALQVTELSLHCSLMRLKQNVLQQAVGLCSVQPPGNSLVFKNAKSLHRNTRTSQLLRTTLRKSHIPLPLKVSTATSDRNLTFSGGTDAGTVLTVQRPSDKADSIRDKQTVQPSSPRPSFQLLRRGHRGDARAGQGGQRRALNGRKAGATTWQQHLRPVSSLPGTKEQRVPRSQARAGKCFRQPGREAAGGEPGEEERSRPRRPSARLFVLQSEGGPLPPAASKRAPSTPSPQGADTSLAAPSQLTKGQRPLFRFPPRSREGPAGMPFTPPTKTSPAAPGRRGEFTHLPAGRPISGTPAPRLVPRQRPGPPADPRSSPRRRMRPRHALSRSEHTRSMARPGPGPAATRPAGAARIAGFHSVDNGQGKQRRRISRRPKRGGNAEEGRPARVRLRPPFCTAREEAAWGRRPF